MEQVQKKGMSKGCLVAIVVAGVLLLLIIIAAVTCYVKRDELAKFGATTVVASFKSELRQHPVEGLDTTRFFGLSDAFAQKLQADSLDYMKYSRFMNTVQRVMEDKKLDSSEVAELSQAMVVYFPELESLAGQSSAPTEQAVPDTMVGNLPDSGK